MIQIQVDEVMLKEMYLNAIAEKVEELNEELVFWDSKELRRRTSLSWNTIQVTFFHEKKFPKAKIGGKWLFPAKETEEFLIKWLDAKRSD